MVPPEVAQRLSAKYPKPTVDPEWLEACYGWVTEHFGLAPRQVDQIVAEVDKQLLDSDLTDSMVPGTGIPERAPNEVKGRIAVDKPILCQIMAITDIGQSAFSLQNVRQV
jgi:RecQ-mediated genome instability protein 1